MSIVKRTWAEISLNNAEENYNKIRGKIGNNINLCCVVKADSYGHGSVNTALLYQKLGANCFGVSNIDEGKELRNAGINKPIIIFGYTPVDEVENIIKYDLTQTIYGKEYGKIISNKCKRLNAKCKIHIKVDTGMGRLGFVCDTFPRDSNSINDIIEVYNNPWFIPEGIFTHFAISDMGKQGEEFTKKQYNNFSHVINELKLKGATFKYCHCSNSAAIEDYSNTYLNMVRAGIILYGFSPCELVRKKLDLKPVMTLKTSVSYVKEIKKGTTLSYGREFTADKTMKVATVAIGYADGYIRSNAKEGYMLVNGQKAKILGRICMDQTIIDISNIKNVNIGDEVIVFGSGKQGEPTASDLAKWTNTIEYEVVSLISKRVPRYYYKDGKKTDVVYKL